ncbi:MAG: hypothetical protein KAI70_03755 [Candidatus Omnitrophica bacterium]|nr:hypothetical protein [Candidatus Omnitrophota bacterium]
MKTEVGEYIVGAYLKIIKQRDIIDYNARPPHGGLEGLGELDVIGLNSKKKTAYICEVTTHIRGILYKDNKTTVERIKKKHKRQKEYAKKYLSNFPNRKYMFWAPVVPRGYITEKLEKIEELVLVINETYSQRIDELREKARILTYDSGNPFFRILQILEHLRR